MDIKKDKMEGNFATLYNLQNFQPESEPYIHFMDAETMHDI